jgi:hypothetical protein
MYVCDAIHRILLALKSNENLAVEDSCTHGSFSLFVMGCMRECVRFVCEMIACEVVKIIAKIKDVCCHS